ESGTPLEGWTFVLSKESMGAALADVTNSTGEYDFDNLEWGVYDLGEELQPGWTQDTANTSVTIDGTNLVEELTFTNTQQKNSARRTKVNESGTPLEGWTFVLSNETFGTTLADVTNSTGHYDFDALPICVYDLGEELQPGWTQSTANTSVTIDGTNLLDGVTFTNT